MARVRRHRCPECNREFRCPHKPSTSCMESYQLNCERCPPPKPGEGPCAHEEPGSVRGAAGTPCREPSVMSGIFGVKRSMQNLAGRQMASEGFEELGFCALHAPESWKKEHGVPLEAKPNMTLGGEWVHLRFDPARRVLVATVLTSEQRTVEEPTLEELETRIRSEEAHRGGETRRERRSIAPPAVD